LEGVTGIGESGMEYGEMNWIPTTQESSKEGTGIPFYPRVSEAYSVQFPLEGSDLKKELKVWHKFSSYMCLLVKEDSDILPLLRTGGTLRMDYYGNDLFAPSEHLETKIRRIKKSEESGLRGYYFIEVGILKRRH
jgi:hypothetical protein